MDGDGDRFFLEAQGARRGLVVDLGHPLHFGEVVPGAERAELGPAALLGAVRDELGPRPLKPPALLDVQQVVGLAEAVLHRPGSAVAQHPFDAVRVEPEVLAVRADTRRNAAEQGLDDVPDTLFRVGRAQT